MVTGYHLRVHNTYTLRVQFLRIEENDLMMRTKVSVLASQSQAKQHSHTKNFRALLCEIPLNSNFEYDRGLQLLHCFKMEISYEQVFQFLNTATYPSNCINNRRRAIRKKARKFSLKLPATPMVQWNDAA